MSGEFTEGGTEVVYIQTDEVEKSGDKGWHSSEPSGETWVVEDSDSSQKIVIDLPCSDSSRDSNIATADEGKTVSQPRRPWYHHPRITEFYLNADWWTLWIGLASFGLGSVLVYAVPLDFSDKRVDYVIPQPMPWTNNPLDAWDWYNLVGIPLLILFFLILYLGSLKTMGNLCGHLFVYTAGFVLMASIATFSLWLGSNEWCSEHGLGYAVIAILLGIAVSNVAVLLGKGKSLEWLQKKAAKDGEYFIKCSLVLLAVELTVLVEVGGPAMIVAWVGSPLAIFAGFVIGTRFLGCNDSLAMLIAVGASWCGASAISAVAPAVMASSEEVALAISIVSFFTVIFTFVQPYIAIAVGMPSTIAGAWIGGSIDQTGNVIVSAAIIDEEATEVAGIVKMVLNAAMGVMASVIACYWTACRLQDENGKPPKFSVVMLWDKFPKFTLGFIITSAIMTGMLQKLEGSMEAEALPRAVSSLNRWWFAIAFVGIGLTTNLKKLFQEAWKSGVIQVYLVANTIDIFLALGLAYFAYAVVD
jgi:uncharacterized membrane protein YadS